jgi:hypothetical protein
MTRALVHAFIVPTFGLIGGWVGEDLYYGSHVHWLVYVVLWFIVAIAILSGYHKRGEI